MALTNPYEPGTAEHRAWEHQLELGNCPRCERFTCGCPSLDEVPWMPGEPPLAEADLAAWRAVHPTLR